MDIPGFEVELAEGGEVVLLRIVGRVEPADLPRVEEAGSRLIAAGRSRFVLDLSRAEDLSEAGLGLILYYQNVLAGKGGGLFLAAPSEPARRALRGARLERATAVYESVAGAVAAARRGPASRKSEPPGS